MVVWSSERQRVRPFGNSPKGLQQLWLPQVIDREQKKKTSFARHFMI